MNNTYVLTYGLFAGAGIGAIAALMSLSELTGGLIPGGGGISFSVAAPLAIASAALVSHCLTRLKKGDH